MSTPHHVAVTIDLDTIAIVEGWNARSQHTPTEARALRDSLAEHGQLSPIIVTDAKHTDRSAPPYNLVAGERRVRAMRALGWRTAQAIIVAPDEALAAHWHENAARQDLSTPDRARYIERLRRTMSRDEVRAVTGLSGPSVSNYVAMVRGLAPTIMDAWASEPGHSAIALRVCRLPHEEQMRAWETYLRGIARQSQTEDGETKPKARRPKSRSAREETVDAALRGSTERPMRTRHEVKTLLTAMGATIPTAQRTDESLHALLRGIQWAAEWMLGGHTTANGLPAWPAQLREAQQRARRASDSARRQTSLPEVLS